MAGKYFRCLGMAFYILGFIMDKLQWAISQVKAMLRKRKPVYISKSRWFDKYYDWSGIIWPIILVLLFVGFQFVLNIFGLYAGVKYWCIMITLLIIYKIADNQIMLYSRGLDVILFMDNVEIQIYGAFFNGKCRISIEPSSIVGLGFYPLFLTEQFPGETDAVRSNGSGNWDGWSAIMNKQLTAIPAFAIETKEYKLVLQSKHLSTLMTKFAELYGVKGEQCSNMIPPSLICEKSSINDKYN